MVYRESPMPRRRAGRQRRSREPPRRSFRLPSALRHLQTVVDLDSVAEADPQWPAGKGGSHAYGAASGYRGSLGT
jgi:hypothetical protein